MKAQLHTRLGVAVSEVDGQDTWQRSTLAGALTSGSFRQLQHATALALIARLRDARLDLPLLGDRRVTARQDREERDHGRNC